MYFSQRTVGKRVFGRGIGLHTGVDVAVEIHPAAPNTGILIRISNGRTIPLCEANTLRTSRCTRIVDPDGNIVDTAEHLLAALAIERISNCLIVFSGTEVPILDGCSDQWISMLMDSGIVDQATACDYFLVTKPYDFDDGPSRFSARPGNDLLHVRIDFPHPVIGSQSIAILRSQYRELASSRTFVLEEDINRLKAAGLAHGGSLDNALVIGRNEPLNKGGFRHPDECVRHKALDLLGDLYVCGRLIVGEISAVKPGHAANGAFLRSLLLSGCVTLISGQSLSSEAA